jgi:hypothetical protein
MLLAGVSEDGAELLTGLSTGGPRRVELNALTTEQLIGLIEEAFEDHLPHKVIPYDMSDAFADAYRRVALERVKIEAPQPPDDLNERVAQVLSENPDLSWDQALYRVVQSV